MVVLMFGFVVVYLAGLFSFSLKRKHLLLMLLSLEFIVISLYMGLFTCLGMFNWELYFVLVFLTMSVCEGVLGLSLLVLLMRMYGNDYVQSLW
uniref:NADH-ubiquinone oxidoreductase chain 4L n=1 Tax=Neolucanus maximus TaxID=618182 RepID=A0A346TLQ2_9SCAR|nr:NADH dehydrogenase subunit 4L [Neolucanus maximus]AXU40292.1 NADH dehydrogenase subunit 4L [Neolucanus maximus]